MLEPTNDEDELATGDWEPWLAERFVAYLLRDAGGQERPAADVERALARLSGQPGALARLASLAFLLEPAIRLGEWLRDEVPAFLRRLRVRSVTVTDVRRNATRGRVDWARTIAIRNATRDPTWIASRSQRRTFDTPELVMVRHVLEIVRRTASAVLRVEGEARTGWTHTIAELAALAAASTSHSALHEVPSRHPDTHERAVARASQDATVRHAAEILDAYDRLLPEPEAAHLRDALARFALVPLNEDVRFQVFALLAVIDCIDRLVAPATRLDRVVVSGRDEVARWDGDGFSLLLHYDQAAEAGVHADVMRHYFGTSQPLRPDLRLELRRGKDSRELIADAKRSTSRRYLADAHHKMRGYIADRPKAFGGSRPKAVIVCPAATVGSPRATDDVVFIGIVGHTNGALEKALASWWSGDAEPGLTSGNGSQSTGSSVTETPLTPSVVSAASFEIWRLQVARALIIEAASRVTLAPFEWTKPPGNRYMTFYPTAWVRNGERVQELLNRTVHLRAHLASYGDDTLCIPWLTAGQAALALTIGPATDPDPAHAARRALASLDLDTLAATGDVDPTEHTSVIAWLDEVLRAAHRPGAHVSMDVDWDPAPDAHLTFLVHDAAGGVQKVQRR
jgi:hypothetical protein